MTVYENYDVIAFKSCIQIFTVNLHTIVDKKLFILLCSNRKKLSYDKKLWLSNFTSQTIDTNIKKLFTANASSSKKLLS